MQRLKVAMIIQGYWPRLGGAERQLGALVPLLRARGVDIHIFTRRYPGLTPFEMVDGVPVHRLPVPGPKAVASLTFSAAALWHLWRLRPDVIHAHELLSPTTTAVAAKRLLGVPVVAKVLRGGTLGDVYKLRRKPAGLARLARFSQEVNAFITISREIDAELAESGVASSKRVFIPNGVDMTRFAPVTVVEKETLRQELGLPAGTITMFTGRLAAEKRIDQLVSVWAAVRRRHEDAHLVIVGSGPEEAALKALAGDGVHFTGQVADVASYLRAADVFVLPSATEGLSNALLEGMAAGLAVVATAVGGAPDLINDGENGRLIAPDTPQELEAALLSLLADDGLRAQMGMLARQRIVSQYALTMTADRLRQLYDRVIDGSATAVAPTFSGEPL